MKTTRLRVAASIVKDFCVSNKKSVISFALVFFIGTVIGIFVAISSSGGEFERIARADMEFGSARVFFLSSLMLLLGYGVILVSAYGTMLSFVSLAVFIASGIYFGKYMCLLVGCYEIIGILNLLFIYIPFFLFSFCFFVIAAVLALNTPGCESRCRGRIRPSAIAVLKVFGLNIAVNFVIFIIIGALTKVIVIGF